MLTAEDIKEIEAMHEARKKGYYYNSKTVTDMYNKLLNKNVTPTNCGSCIRRRCDEIWAKYQEIIKLTTPKEDGKKEVNQGDSDSK